MNCVYCTDKAVVYCHYITKELTLSRGAVCVECYTNIGGTILTRDLTPSSIELIERKMKGTSNETK